MSVNMTVSVAVFTAAAPGRILGKLDESDCCDGDVDPVVVGGVVAGGAVVVAPVEDPVIGTFIVGSPPVLMTAAASAAFESVGVPNVMVRWATGAAVATFGPVPRRVAMASSRATKPCGRLAGSFSSMA